MTSKDGEFVQWYKREWIDYDAVKTTKKHSRYKVALEAAVHRQLMSDVPYGCFTFWRIRFFIAPPKSPGDVDAGIPIVLSLLV
jgi:hypothetical protein